MRRRRGTEYECVPPPRQLFEICEEKGSVEPDEEVNLRDVQHQREYFLSLLEHCSQLPAGNSIRSNPVLALTSQYFPRIRELRSAKYQFNVVDSFRYLSIEESAALEDEVSRGTREILSAWAIEHALCAKGEERQAAEWVVTWALRRLAPPLDEKTKRLMRALGVLPRDGTIVESPPQIPSMTMPAGWVSPATEKLRSRLARSEQAAGFERVSPCCQVQRRTRSRFLKP